MERSDEFNIHKHRGQPFNRKDVRETICFLLPFGNKLWQEYLRDVNESRTVYLYV